jgi:hypothetical protein
MGPATDQPTEYQDHQETMFEESTSFPGPARTNVEQEQSYEAHEDAGTADSLPDEAPDDDVMTGAASSSSVPAASIPESSSPAAHASHHPAQGESTASSSESLTALTIDDFAALEERVLRAVNLVRRERQARHTAEERLLILESQFLAQSPALEQLEQEVEALRVEREHVRQRVERLLSQLDALEL